MHFGKVLGCSEIMCSALWSGAWAQSEPPETTGVFPPVVGRFVPSLDPIGIVETYNIDAPTVTATHPFFESLGTNGRAGAPAAMNPAALGESAWLRFSEDSQLATALTWVSVQSMARLGRANPARAQTATPSKANERSAL